MLSSALVPRSQRKYPAHSAALALYPAAPLSAAVTFVFFAICLTTESKTIFSSFKQRHEFDEAGTMSPLARRKFFLAAEATLNVIVQVPVSVRA